MRARVLPYKHLWVCVRFLFCFIPNARGKRGELGRQLLMPIHQFKWIRNSWRIFAQKICLHRNVFCINMNLIWHFSVREIVSIVIGWNCQIKQRLIAKLIPFGNLTKTSCKRGHKGKQRLFFLLSLKWYHRKLQNVFDFGYQFSFKLKCAFPNCWQSTFAFYSLGIDLFKRSYWIRVHLWENNYFYNIFFFCCCLRLLRIVSSLLFCIFRCQNQFQPASFSSGSWIGCHRKKSANDRAHSNLNHFYNGTAVSYE